MVKRRLAFRKKRQNRLGMFLVSTAVVMLLLVVGIKSIELREKQRVYAYTKTKKYAEEVAKDKLGLVHDGEIIFKEKK